MPTRNHFKKIKPSRRPAGSSARPRMSSVRAVRQAAFLRVIDANLNRLRDGLRVIEDTLRFVYPESGLWDDVRNLRNRVGRIFSDTKIYSGLLVSRDSSHDPGSASAQKKHKDIPSLLRANFARASESLRVLEEYSRFAAPRKVSLFKKIRFTLYEIEKNASSFIR